MELDSVGLCERYFADLVERAEVLLLGLVNLRDAMKWFRLRTHIVRSRFGLRRA